MEEKRITVVTVSYNQGDFIRKNIESVLAQEYGNFEHIIIDAGSKDNTIDILKEYPHLKWVSEPDKGQSDGLNKGFRKATGDIVYWINSDDYVAPNSFNAINRFFNENLDASVVVGNQVIVGGNDEVINVLKAKKYDYDFLLNGVKNGCMQNSTVFKLKVLENVGLLDESFHYTMDQELFVRIASKYKFYNIDKDIACFRVWGDSKTSMSKIKFFKELLKIKNKHKGNVFSSSNIWILWQFVKEPFRRVPFLKSAFGKYIKI